MSLRQQTAIPKVALRYTVFTSPYLLTYGNNYDSQQQFRILILFDLRHFFYCPSCDVEVSSSGSVTGVAPIGSLVSPGPGS
jgi:hypothetical protein